MLNTLMAPAPFWIAVTRLGEAQVMLPAVLLALLWLATRPNARPLVGWWLGTLTFAVLLTTASKIAFIGYGWGVPALDFTGVSGHAMFAAAVYPLLFRVLVASRPSRWQGAAVAGGVALAVLVGLSRLVVQAHSLSEVLAGWALGGAVSGAALAMARLPTLRLPSWLPLAALASLLVLGNAAPPSRSHDMVTRLSLVLSGRSAPYTRWQMQHPTRSLHRPAPAAPMQAAWHGPAPSGLDQSLPTQPGAPQRHGSVPAWWVSP